MGLIFRKKLSDTDVSCRLSVKTKSLGEFPPFEGDQHYQLLMIEDEIRKKHCCRLSVRKDGHQKPVLSGGWRRIVASMNLQEDDELLFMKEVHGTPGGVTYKIIRFYKFL